jgi:hypothetical protein
MAGLPGALITAGFSVFLLALAIMFGIRWSQGKYGI